MALEQQNVPAPGITYSGVEFLTSSPLIKLQMKYKEDFDPRLIGRFNDWDLGVGDLIEEFGGMEGVDGNTYSHGEEDRNRYVIRVDAGYSVGAATTTFTVSNSSPDFVDEYPTSGESIYTASSTKYGVAVRYGDKLEATVSGTTYYMWVNEAPDLSVSAPTFKVTLIDTTSPGAASTFSAGIANVEIFCTGNAMTETGSPDGTRETRIIKYENKIQRSGHVYEYSNSARFQATAFGGEFKYSYIRGSINERKVFNAIRDIDFLVSRQITNTSFTEETAMTEGYVPFLLNYANEISYSSITLAKFSELSIILRQNDGPDKMMTLANTSNIGAIDDMFRGQTGLTDGGIVYDSSGSGEREVNLAFRNFNYYDVTYNVRSFKAMDDRASLNSAQSQYKNYLLFCPTGTVSGYDYGSKAPIEIPAMGMKYPLNLEDTHEKGYREFPLDGSAGPVPVNKSGLNELVYQQYFGASFAKSNTHAIMTK